MALTNSQPNNINVPSGNGLVVYLDGETNQVYVRDVRGATEELNVLTSSLTDIVATGGLTALKVGSIVTIGTDASIIQLKAEKGQPNGYASLDATGKLPVSELPVSVLTYEGTWNAATNTPTLADGTGNAGDFYIVSVAGTQNLGSGPITFEVGDWVIYNGTIWQRNSSNLPDLQEVTDIGATTTNAITTGGITSDYVQLDLTATPTLTVGMARWNSSQLTWEVGVGAGPVAYEMGQSLFYPQVRNTSGTNLPKGTLVMVDPSDISTGDRLNVIRAVANGTYISQLIVGVLAQAISSGQTGIAVWFGQIYSVSTSSINLGGETWADGNILYADPANPGGYTNVEPTAPNLKVTVAVIQSINGGNVNLLVRPWLNEKIGQLSDVAITSPVDNSILQFNSTTGVWEDVAGTTTNIAEGTNLYFTTQRARDSVSAGLGISYDSSTGIITNSDRGSSQNIYKQIAVATQPTLLATSNNTVLTVIAGTNIILQTDAVNNSLTIDATGTTTGSGTTNYLSKWTGTTALGDSQVFDNGTNVGIGTSAPTSILQVGSTANQIFNLDFNTANTIKLAGQTPTLWLEATPTNPAQSTAVILRANSTAGVIQMYAGTKSVQLNQQGTFSINAIGGPVGTNLYVNGPAQIGDSSGSTAAYLDINAYVAGVAPILTLRNRNDGAVGRGSKITFYNGFGTIAEKANLSVTSIDGTGDGFNMSFATTATGGTIATKMQLLGSGTLVLNSYGSGTKTGTVSYNLGVDASGNIIETPGSVIDGSGTTNYISKFTDSNTIGDSIIYDSGSAVGIGTITPSTKLQVDGTVTATTFAGDLNGTINTATTGFTQSNSDNSTKIATTAFVQNLLATVPAGLSFQGTWNAATNTPTLTSSVGTPGYFYIVSVEGTTNLNGITDWKVGDWAVFVEAGGTDAWQKVDNTSVLDGAGTGGYIAQWAGSGTSVTLEDSVIYDTGTNIGIGTVTPQGKLDVNGAIISTSSKINALADGILLSLRTTYAGNAAIVEAGQTGSDGYLNVKNATGTIYSSLSGYFGTPSYFLSDVGIGTTTPLGILHLYKSAATTRVVMDGDAGQSKIITYRTGGLQRFGLYVNNTAESGSNAGSNFAIRAYSDAGTLLSTPFFINRATGNVGIGTTNPSNKLTVQGGTITAGSEGTYGLMVKNGTKPVTIGSDDNYGYIQTWSGAPLYINSQGNNVLFPSSGTYVGIGLTSPLGPLSVAATASADAIFLTGRSADNASRIDFYNNAQSTRLFTIAPSNGAVEMYADANVPMTFSTAGNERMRITAIGNVGIGTTSPSQLLHLNAASGAVYTRVQNNINSLYLGLESGGIAQVSSDVSSLKVMANTFTSFETGGSERMRITAGGNVLIGTTTDAGYKLDVNGTFNVTGTGRFTDTLNLVKGANNSVGVGSAIYFQGGSGSSYNILQQGVGTFIIFGFDGASWGEKLIITNTTGALNLPGYGSGSKTGTPTYNLAVDASGNIIETAGGVVDGSGTANYVTKWQDSNTITNSVLYDDGTNIGLGTTSPAVKLDVQGSINLKSTFNLTWGGAYGAGVPTITGNYISSFLAFYPAGSTSGESMRLASSGNLLIGTTTDSGYKLYVNGTGFFNDILSVQAGNTYPIRAIATAGGTSRISFQDNVNNSNDSVFVGSIGFNLIFGANYDEQARIASSGNFLIGTTSDAGYKLYVNGNTYVNGTITEASARHLKENIKPLESTLDKVNALRPVTYNLIGSDKNEIGLIAEEVAELFPQVVEYNEEGNPSGVNYTRLSVILIKALQEMSETLNKLQTK